MCFWGSRVTLSTCNRSWAAGKPAPQWEVEACPGQPSQDKLSSSGPEQPVLGTGQPHSGWPSQVLAQGTTRTLSVVLSSHLVQ